MIIKQNSIVEISKGLKFMVLDIKTFQNKEVALVQGVEDGVLRFVVEKVDEKENKIDLMFIEDVNLIKEIALEFDRQDGKA